MYRGANTLCLLCAEVLSVGTARHGPARAWRGLSQRQIQESNTGRWASTLVVPYPFDPEFWSGCSSSVGGTGTFQSKNCDKSKMTSISKGGKEGPSGFFGFYQLFDNFIMEPTGSGQIEIERVCVPSF